MTWWPLLLGWPAIALAAVLATAGFMQRSEYLVLGAIVPIIPVGLYVLGSPTYWWVPVIVFSFLLVAAWLLRRARKRG